MSAAARPVHAMHAADANEAALVQRWLESRFPPLTLADGRPLRVIFPGVPGPGHGPDIRGAMLDAGGDYLRGDIEIHLRASGWAAHGHTNDPAYAGVVLHVVAENDTGATHTAHAFGRWIPVLVLPPPASAPRGEALVPPCSLRTAAGAEITAPLANLARRRLRQKAARWQPLAASQGPAQALYAALLETLGGTANRDAFASLAETLPLAALLERSSANTADHALVIAAELRRAARDLLFRIAGMRPAAHPHRRLEAAAALVAQLWPRGPGMAWPTSLAPGRQLSRQLTVPGIGRSLAIELATNAVIPVALAAGEWPEAACEAALAALPSPGTYGVLKSLERWLTAANGKPFTSAATLQAGLLLHRDYCTRGMCGRCPLSE